MKASANVSSTSRSQIGRATNKDQAIIVEILCKAFKNDPHMNWLLAKSRNPNKLKIMMSYLVQKTLKIGEIYLSNDKKAVALWKSNKQESISIESVKRNLKFLLEIGLPSVIRILRNERFTHKQYPKRQSYIHLYLIGVLPECQGQGYASSLMNPVLEQTSKKTIPIYVETANASNVKIYERKGFKVYNTWFNCGLQLYYLKKEHNKSQS